MEKDVGPHHAPHLRKLLKRPGLDKKNKKRARALIARAGADAGEHRH
jgi:hypothetical protein